MLSGFKRIDHQFSLFDFDQMKPKTKIPINRISKERYDQALAEWRKGKKKNMLGILRDINDSLENYLDRIK